mgnify:CR=1 FL=1
MLNYLRKYFGITFESTQHIRPLTIRVAPNSDVVEDASKHGAVALEVSLADLHTSQDQGQAPECDHQARAVVLVVLDREAPGAGRVV